MAYLFFTISPPGPARRMWHGGVVVRSNFWPLQSPELEWVQFASSAAWLPRDLQHVIRAYLVWGSNVQVGDQVDAQDRQIRSFTGGTTGATVWRDARVIGLDADRTLALVHFAGWSPRWDEWLPLRKWPPFVAPARSVCGSLGVGQQVQVRQIINGLYCRYSNVVEATIRDICARNVSVVGIHTGQVMVIDLDTDVSILPQRY